MQWFGCYLYRSMKWGFNNFKWEGDEKQRLPKKALTFIQNNILNNYGLCNIKKTVVTVIDFLK